MIRLKLSTSRSCSCETPSARRPILPIRKRFNVLVVTSLPCLCRLETRRTQFRNALTVGVDYWTVWAIPSHRSITRCTARYSKPLSRSRLKRKVTWSSVMRMTPLTTALATTKHGSNGKAEHNFGPGRVAVPLATAAILHLTIVRTRRRVPTMNLLDIDVFECDWMFINNPSSNLTVWLTIGDDGLPPCFFNWYATCDTYSYDDFALDNVNTVLDANCPDEDVSGLALE